MESSNPKPPNCFYMCGLTGGPIFPVPAIIAQVKTAIPDAKPILIGVRNSYESKLASEQNLTIEFLSKAKLDLLSFQNLNLVEFIIGLLKSIWSVLLLICSFARCFFLLAKYRPILIYSTGSFLAVPMLWAAKLTNLLKITKSVIVAHQQDATLGLANKLTANLADLKSCVFEYTKNNYSQFADSNLIPNPIIVHKYNSINIWQDKHLESFVKDKSGDKPLMLIFGGGSGALAINNWVEQNLNQLTQNFKIVHLSGLLQKEDTKLNKTVASNSPREGEGTARFPCDMLSEGWQSQTDGVLKMDATHNGDNLKTHNGDVMTASTNPNYHTQTAVLHDMPTLLASADLVICRAGLGSISELSLLNKPTFLVPIPGTHQEQNAKLISESSPNFKILDQNKQTDWINQIQTTNFEANQAYFDQKALDQYYQKLIKLLD
jgi:UDP-N-acetylglucosamine--N-acetylmuramyl-(pentapeptide) pyrophosphoryl-undecaprenol N-acetylglucosamine transferase